MPYLYKSGKQYGVANVNIIGKASQELTQAQYNALSDAQKKDGTIYFVTDGAPDAVIVDDPAPIGAIMSYGGDTAPTGWLICDGSPVSRTVYSQLFDVIGETYGAGDGSTTFNVPDLKGRVAIGLDIDAEYGLGDTGGEEDHNHKYGTVYAQYYGAVSGGEPVIRVWDYENNTLGSYEIWTSMATQINSALSGAFSNVSHGTIITEGMTSSSSNMQPYIVTNYIIKAFDNSTSDSTLQSMTDYFYPVGSYYETSDSTFDPNVTFGGTWELETEGQVHIGAGENYELGDTGGESEHILVLDEMPSHYGHGSPWSGNYAAYVNKSVATAYGSGGRGWSLQNSNELIPTYVNLGGDQAHNNMQPYIVVNRWHRIA